MSSTPGTIGSPGKCPANIGSEAANVRVHGPQSDLGEFYARSTICVVPLRFGTGLKIKLIEAMVHGRAVVSTAVGAEGFVELESGEIALLADDAESMVKAICNLLYDPVARDAQVIRQNAWLRQRCLASRAIVPLLEFVCGILATTNAELAPIPVVSPLT